MPKKGENIYKRKDGRWEGRYIKDRTISGKAVYGYVYAQTYRETKSKLSAAQTAIQSPVKSVANAPSVLVEQVSCNWLTCQQSRIKESTYNKYRNLVYTYIVPVLGAMPLSKLTDEAIDHFCQKLLLDGGKKASGLSSKTVADTLSVMRRILEYCDAQNYGPVASAKKISIKREEKELRVLSCTEQDRLCAYLVEHLNDRNLGILLCLFTGLRIGELCALTWDDISIADRTVHIHQTMQRIQTEDHTGGKTKIIISTPKSKCSIRTIPLTEEIASILAEHKKHGYLLTGSTEHFVEPRTMQNHFKRVTAQSGIHPANFHALRHSFATRCVELGFDIKSLSEILGHASVNITMNRYVHPSMELKRQNMQRLSQLIAVK